MNQEQIIIAVKKITEELSNVMINNISQFHDNDSCGDALVIISTSIENFFLTEIGKIIVFYHELGMDEECHSVLDQFQKTVTIRLNSIRKVVDDEIKSKSMKDKH